MSPLPSPSLLSSLAALPLSPGVYIFKDAAGRILYVGKAKKLHQRVRSYFQPPIKLEIKTAKLVSQIHTLEHIEVQSEIESLLLESRLIKKFKPPYNIISKDDKSPYYIHITREIFPQPIINHEPNRAVAGPILSGMIARKLLHYFRRVAPYCTASRSAKRPCMYSHLGLCDPCPGNSSTTPAAYRRNIARLRRLLTGNFTYVKTELQRHMAFASKIQDYERAAHWRDHLTALDKLLQTPIMPDEYLINPNLVADQRQQSLAALASAMNYEPRATSSLHRIELYDIANLSGTSATGAMVVAIDGEVMPKHYRHFTIKSKDTPDDVGMLREVLTRRLKRTDWPMPDLIVLDGGKSQLSILHELRATSYVLPPTIGLAKQLETIITPTTQGYSEINLPPSDPGLQLLQRLRDEAHRFSRRLHHKHRAKLITG